MLYRTPADDQGGPSRYQGLRRDLAIALLVSVNVGRSLTEPMNRTQDANMLTIPQELTRTLVTLPHRTQSPGVAAT
jgi:hypothetical protein